MFAAVDFCYKSQYSKTPGKVTQILSSLVETLTVPGVEKCKLRAEQISDKYPRNVQIWVHSGDRLHQVGRRVWNSSGWFWKNVIFNIQTSFFIFFPVMLFHHSHTDLKLPKLLSYT